MPFSLGDVSIEGTANVAVERADFNFENFLSIHSTFNPYTFAAGLLMDIWKAEASRKQHEEQMAVLRAIEAKLDKLNQTAEAILRALDALPEKLGRVLEVELLKQDLRTRWSTLDASQVAFATVNGYSLQPAQWTELTEAFDFVATHEFRASYLARIPKSAELLNYLSAGKWATFANHVVVRATERIKDYQVKLGERMIATTKAFLTQCIDQPPKDWTGRYTKLTIDSDYRTVQDLRAAKIRVVVVPIGSKPEPTVPGPSLPGPFSPIPTRQPNPEFIKYQVETSEQVRKQWQDGVDARHADFEKEMNQLFEAFNNYQALRQPLAAVAAFDFAKALRGVRSRI